jgi:hypothetical protein
MLKEFRAVWASSYEQTPLSSFDWVEKGSRVIEAHLKLLFRKIDS